MNVDLHEGSFSGLKFFLIDFEFLVYLDYIEHLEILDYIDYIDYFLEPDFWMATSLLFFTTSILNFFKKMLRLLRLLRVHTSFSIFVFLAFRINCSNRAKESRYLRHRLCSRAKDDKPQDYTAFDWKSILHGNAGKLGDYK